METFGAKELNFAFFGDFDIVSYFEHKSHVQNSIEAIQDTMHEKLIRQSSTILYFEFYLERMYQSQN